MCGCCESEPSAFKNKYKEKEKGITKLHPHMLIYSNFYWKEYPPEGMKCISCSFDLSHCGSFKCRSCSYYLCPKCFYYSSGDISNDFQVNQKGRLNLHQHILIYQDVISRNIPITANPLFVCKGCGAEFLMEYAESWNCPKCGIDFCDKCFIDNKGEII